MGNAGRRLRAPLARTESAMTLLRDSNGAISPDVHARDMQNDQIESLDFYNRDSLIYRQYLSTKDKLWNMEKTATKWFLYFIEGIVIGLLAYGIRKSVYFLQDVKFDLIGKYFINGQFFAAFGVYLGISLGFTLVAFSICALCGPLSTGSGIPEVKGYLNGVKISGTVNIKTFLGKIFSLIFAFSAGLALGPEGPMVHIGAIVGAGIALGKSRTLGIRLPAVFSRFRNDADQRDFIASGAAAGMAAAFGAPIGGVLYAFEEASSFWSQQLTWRTFFGCMISAFTVSFMFKLETGILQHGYGLLTFGVSRKYLYRYEELLPFAFLGILAGALGALFVYLNGRITRWRKERLGTSIKLRFLEILVIALVTFTIAFIVPLFYSCRSIHSIRYNNETCDVSHVGYPARGYCPENEYNPMSNLILQPVEQALRFMYARASGIYPFEALIVFFLVYFGLVTITSGSYPLLKLIELNVNEYTAAGLFVPMMVVGAAMGQIMGMLLQLLLPRLNPPIDPSIYSLVGSAAMITGVSRITISLCVIILEITEATQYLLPLMLGVLCAKWAGDALTPAHSDVLMEAKNVPYLEPRPPHSTLLQTVSDVMEPSVVCLEEVARVSDIFNALHQTKHNGFPVIFKSPGASQGTFRGLMLRHDLLLLLDHRMFFRRDLDIDPPHMGYDEWQDLLGRKPPSVDSLYLTPDEMNSLCDLRPFMNQSALSVHARCAYSEAYRLFRKMELRHLVVVDDTNQVVGIMTRKDLLFFHHVS